MTELPPIIERLDAAIEHMMRNRPGIHPDSVAREHCTFHVYGEHADDLKAELLRLQEERDRAQKEVNGCVDVMVRMRPTWTLDTARPSRQFQYFAESLVAEGADEINRELGRRGSEIHRLRRERDALLEALKAADAELTRMLTAATDWDAFAITAKTGRAEAWLADVVDALDNAIDEANVEGKE